MRVVFDTNILISAALITNSVSFQVFSKAFHTCRILVSEDTLQEFVEVLHRKKFDKYLSVEKRRIFLAEFARIAEAVLVDVTITDCSDPKDNKFLELAVSGSADCIVSGDNHLRQPHPYLNIPIITPTDFLKLSL